MSDYRKTFLELARECERKFGLPDTENLALQALIQAVIRGESWAVKDLMDRCGYKSKDTIQADEGVCVVINGVELGEIKKGTQDVSDS